MYNRKDWNREVLEEVSIRLLHMGFTTTLVSGEETGGYETLRSTFYLGEEPVEATAMDMAFYNIEDFEPMMQVFIYMNQTTDLNRLDAIKESIEEGNRYAPVGHFGIFGEEQQVYYRHSIIFYEQDRVDEAVERVMSVLTLMLNVAATHQKNYVTVK